MSEFYVTLFSNSDQKKYTNNSTSKFTVTLPKPINIDQTQWCVGLTDCYHPKIIGTVSGEAEGDQDKIVLPYLVSESTFSYDLNALVNLILSNAVRPNLYTKRFFYEFLNRDNLKEFEVNPNLSQYKTTMNQETHIFKIAPFKILPQFRNKQTMVARTYIQFESQREYTMKEILHIILSTYYTILNKSKVDNEYGIVVEPGKTIGEMLYLYCVSFVNTVRNVTLQYTENISNYLLIYSDIVEGSIVGSEVVRFLYAAPRHSEVERDAIEIRNIKYFRLCKSYISEISLIFCDERGRQIMFQDGYLPCYVTLHFKKV